jgi:transposase
MEPTNNVAEQAIRFVVIDRHITQGTRSEQGNRWSERIGTVIATCAIQGQSVYAFLYASVCAFWDGTAPPHLLLT